MKIQGLLLAVIVAVTGTLCLAGCGSFFGMKPPTDLPETAGSAAGSTGGTVIRGDSPVGTWY